MEIFICWSGTRSHRLAELLQTYLPKFIPGLEKKKLFVSSENIPKGTRWFDTVGDGLDSANAGVVCLTREALQSGWIHFEAGALARAVRRKQGALYTYLLGVEPGELNGPLAEFQSTRFDREDTRRLCAAIVDSMKEKAPPRKTWEGEFDRHWTEFADAVGEIGPLPVDKLIPGLEDIFRRKTFNEPIEECTRQAWLDRYTGVRETIAGLKTFAPIMKTDNSYLLDIYNELLEQLDAYAMNMGALLLEEKRFEVRKDDGKLEIGDGIKRACESRRGKIRHLVTHLLAPNCAPVLEEESRRFAKLTSFDAKKTIMIHPAESRIRAGKRSDRLSTKQLQDCAGSLWEFDRIYYYLSQERSTSPDIDQLIDNLEQELEKLRAVEGGASLIPLHYAIRALKRTSPKAGTEQRAKLRLFLSAIETFVVEYGLDTGHQVRDNIEEFRLLLGAVNTRAKKASR